MKVHSPWSFVRDSKRLLKKDNNKQEIENLLSKEKDILKTLPFLVDRACSLPPQTTKFKFNGVIGTKLKSKNLICLVYPIDVLKLMYFKGNVLNVTDPNKLLLNCQFVIDAYAKKLRQKINGK